MRNEKCVVRTRIQILENKVPDLSRAWFSKVTNHIPVLQRHLKAIYIKEYVTRTTSDFR